MVIPRDSSGSLEMPRLGLLVTRPRQMLLPMPVQVQLRLPLLLFKALCDSLWRKPKALLLLLLLLLLLKTLRATTTTNTL